MPSALVEHLLLDLLAPLGKLSARAMFGGHGLYFDGKIFGIEAGGTIYFKVTPSNRANYQAAGSHPFQYASQHKSVTLTYWKVPDEVLENRELALSWATDAIKASRELPPAKRKKA